MTTRSLFLGFCVLLFGAPVGAVKQYSVEYLGVSPEYAEDYPLFGFVDLEGFNDRGDVIGNSGTPVGDRGWIWTRKDGVQVLGTLSRGGPNDASVYGINNAGQIVGGSSIDQPVHEHAFLYDKNHGLQDIAVLSGQSEWNSRAYGINAGGSVIGSVLFDGTWQAFLWRPKKGMILLTDPAEEGARTSAAAISDRGHVAGSHSTPPGTQAFIWTERAGVRRIGTLSGTEGWSVAADVNERGAVVGSSSWSTGARGFYWSPASGMVNLGDLRGGADWSSAVAVNNHGTVVGNSGAHDGGEPFVWYPGEGMYELEDLIDPLDPHYGANLTYVIDINERGQILVGAQRYWELGYILTPREPVPNAQ